MAADVFISYKAEEFDEANYMKMVLEKNGITCWMAPACIPGGSNYAKEIPQAIREAKIFLLILSQKAQESKWVPRELDQAINSGKIVMPFMIENCTLSDDFNFYLSNVQRYTAYENKTAAINKVILEIKGILGISGNLSNDSEKPTDNPPLESLRSDLVEELTDNSVAKSTQETKENTTVSADSKTKKKNFFSKFNAFRWKHADEPKFRFSLRVFYYCSLVLFVLTLLTSIMSGISLYTYEQASFSDVVPTTIISLLIWYIGYLLCHFLVKIKRGHKVFSLIFGIVTSIFLYFVLLYTVSEIHTSIFFMSIW